LYINIDNFSLLSLRVSQGFSRISGRYKEAVSSGGAYLLCTIKEVEQIHAEGVGPAASTEAGGG
jgi:hypothetical protein